MDRRDLLLGGIGLAAGSAASAQDKYNVENGSQSNVVAASGRRQTILQATDGEHSVKRKGSTAVVRTLASRADDRFDLRDFGAVRRQSTSNEYTAEIQAALNQAAAENINTIYCEENYRVSGLIVIPSGVSLVSAGGSTSYYDPAVGGYPARPATGFFKPTTGNNGPLVIMGIGSSLIGMTLDHQKIGGATVALGGVLQMGPKGPLSNNCNNMTVSRCTISGHEIDYEPGGTRLRRRFAGNVSGSADCALMVFPATPVGTQRYNNSCDSVRLGNGAIGLWLGNQANANSFTKMMIHQVYRQILMDGGAGEVLGNNIEGLFTNTGFLPTRTHTAEAIELLSYAAQAASQADNVVISAIARVQQNRITGYTECNGRTVSAAGEAITYFNDLTGLRTNERYTDHYPDAWAMPLAFYNANVVRNNSYSIIAYHDSNAAAYPKNHSEGFGTRLRIRNILSNNLPQMAGLNIAANSNSRTILRWVDPATVRKSLLPTINGMLRVEVEAPSGGGLHLTEVDFGYRVTNKTTAAGELIVKAVRQYPASPNNYLTGLNFLTGESTGVGMGFAATLGNVSPVTATSIAVTLDCDVSFLNDRIWPYYKMAQTYAYCVNVDSQTVAEAKSMLTVGTQAV